MTVVFPLERILNGENFTESVEGLLKKVEERMRAQAEGARPELAAALNHLLSSGGKRVRPALSLLTGKMLGVDVGRLITLSAAIELLHSATLVHDDLIDGALVRRGIPTINARWSPAATVLTGDFIFARAAKLAADADSLPAMRLFAETLAIIVNGEINQMFVSRGNPSREDYYRRIYAKTASLFETATTTVAMISAADEVTAQKVQRYGYEIGMAFQMVDDILDFTGEQATLGKPVASDLRQGLITLPALYYLESHPEDAHMKQITAGNSLDDAAMSQLLASIRASNAIQQAAEEARQSAQRGAAALEGLPDCIERHALANLAAYIVKRTL